MCKSVGFSTDWVFSVLNTETRLCEYESTAEIFSEREVDEGVPQLPLGRSP